MFSSNKKKKRNHKTFGEFFFNFSFTRERNIFAKKKCMKRTKSSNGGTKLCLVVFLLNVSCLFFV